MEFIIQVLLIGITVGAVYGLVAVGWGVLVKSTGILNIAQGQLVMIASYICYTFSNQIGLPFWMAIILTLGVAALLGIFIERTMMRPMIGEPLMSVCMITIALASVLDGVVQMIWGPMDFTYKSYLPDQPIVFGNIFLSSSYIFAFVIAMLVLVGLILFFRFTKAGLAMRGVAENQTVAQSLGVNVGFISSTSWAICCMTAAMGGMILATIVSVSLSLSNIGMVAIPAVIVGGMESLPGAVIGGLIIGITRAFTGTYLDKFMISISEITPYIIMMIILIVKPYGLFGLKEIERV